MRNLNGIKKSGSWGAALATAIVGCLAVTGWSTPAFAQATFDSTSDGTDGALDFTGTAPGTTIMFDPTTFMPPLDADGDGIYHFTTITIPVDVTIRLRADKVPGAMHWLAQGAVVIDGTLDLSGEDGHPPVSSQVFPAIPGPGGFFGGLGRTPFSSKTNGFGPGGAIAFSTQGTGGSYATPGFDGGAFGTPETYGNTFIMPLLGGSGGSGANIGPGLFEVGAGGGAGGGAILIASNDSISLTGTISSTGGDGYDTPIINTFWYDGGTGSGGAVRLLAPVITGVGSISASGGIIGPAQSGLGGLGRVRIESFDYLFTGTITGDFRRIRLTPNVVFLPTQLTPAVRVLSIAGVPVPSSPMGSIIMPDVTINEAGQVAIEIEAGSIPVGTVVTLNIFSDSDGSQTVSSTPLAGADDSLTTATAMATFSPGVSQFFIQAKWTP